MSDDLLNILSNSNKDIDNQLLMDYLAGKLSGQQKHEVEKWMADSEFMNDAVEGLEAVENKKDLNLVVAQLNQDLHKKLSKKKDRKGRRRFKDTPWAYLAVLLIIVLAILSYIILQKLRS